MLVLLTTPVDVLNTAVLFIGFSLLIIIVGLFCYAGVAMGMNKPVIPWGIRRRREKMEAEVAHARARAEIANIRIDEEAAEIKLLALQPKRNLILAAIEAGEDVDLADLLADKKKKTRQITEGEIETGTVNDMRYVPPSPMYYDKQAHKFRQGKTY